MEEHAYYHACALAVEGSYHTLKSAKAAHRTWKRAWGQFSASEAKTLEPEAEWGRLVEKNIRLLLQDDEAYPRLLREIPYPPFGVYVRGSVELLGESPAVALVGTRNATLEGKDLAKEFASRLAAAGCTLVSGLALGIDAQAHRGALEVHGKTIAVLACGVDRIYPRLHEALGEEILSRGGAIISEYPPGSPPFPYRFLERNRLVSGLSQGVVIVEAPVASGALVTARFAVEQNREVFVVPGFAKHPNFKGSHRLIRDGALLVTTPEEVLEALGLRDPEERNALFPSTPEAEQIVKTISSASAPITVDKIIELTNLNVQTVNQAVTFLLLQGKIKENGEGHIIISE
jgi:DNA processing protein